MRSTVQVKQLATQYFATFKKVRQLESSLYGKYSLYSKNGFKYIGKQLSKEYQLLSYRNTTYPVLRHKSKEDSIYLFPLHGQPLFNFMSKMNQDGQIKRWCQRHVTLENCLWDIIRFMANLIEKKRLTEILLECLRVHNGSLQYCYDSWMNQSHTIVLNNQAQIENFYFSQEDLDRLRQIIDFPENDSCYQFQVSKKSLYFRLFMMVLHLGTNNLKQRNYEFGYYQINRSHLKLRLEYFCSRYNAKNLGNLAKIIIQQDNYDLCQIGKLCLPQTVEQKHMKSINNASYSSMDSNFKSRKMISQNDQSHSPIKISQIGKLNTSYISNISHNSLEQDNKFFLQKSTITQNKSQLRVREQNISSYSVKSSEISKAKCNNQSEQIITKIQPKKTSQTKGKFYKILNTASKKQFFNLRNILNQNSQIPLNGMKVLKFFGLEQYIPENSYQEHILKSLENIHVKNDWTKQFYQNGSIYFGQMLQNKKSGKGMYLFNSNDFYFGDWIDNCMDGYGCYIFSSGQIYEGELKKGFKQGHGKCTYQDGKEYEGSWVNNYKIGLGKVLFPNQVVFIGVFRPKSNQTQGLFIGPIGENGKPIWQNQGILQHYHWQKNLIFNDKQQQEHDKKTKLITYASQNYCEVDQVDGDVYEGQISNSKKQGFGILQNQRQKFQGFWHQGNRQGQGTLVVKNMFSVKGKWKNNIMVEYIYDEDEES